MSNAPDFPDFTNDIPIEIEEGMFGHFEMEPPQLQRVPETQNDTVHVEPPPDLSELSELSDDDDDDMPPLTEQHPSSSTSEHVHPSTSGTIVQQDSSVAAQSTAEENSPPRDEEGMAPSSDIQSQPINIPQRLPEEGRIQVELIDPREIHQFLESVNRGLLDTTNGPRTERLHVIRLPDEMLFADSSSDDDLM